MRRKTDKEYIEQKQKIKILEQENEFLSLKAQENQLLSKAFEEIYKHEDSESIYVDILEHISILLNIDYCGVFELKSHELINLKSYSQSDHEDSVRNPLTISESLSTDIKTNETLFLNKEEAVKSFEKTIGFSPGEILIIKIEDQLTANLYFIFADKNESGSIHDHIQLLKKIADITSVKLEKIYYKEKLRKTNLELEQRVQERTKELTDLNDELHKNLEYINNINAELEESKERAERSDRLKTDFINNMSHEIRTPLNGILGFANLLSDEGLTDQQKGEYINVIQGSGKQLLRIVEDILEISKLGTKQLEVRHEELNLNEFLEEVYSIFKKEVQDLPIDIKIVNQLSGGDYILYTDKDKLQRILYNLIENAIKFTNSGFIEIGMQNMHTVKEYAGGGDNNTIQFYVKDTGIGIKPENLQNIFERFVQEEQGLSRIAGGLGLGLSIAKENADLLDGKITVKSEKDKGSIFYVTLPFKTGKEKREKQTGREDLINKFRQNHVSILIAEDEMINYQYLKEVILKLNNNINIVHAKNGKEAIDLCKESDFAIVLMDLKMPVCNGLDATKEIKSFKPEMTIVAQTAYATSEDESIARRSGCDDFLTKPIAEDSLYQLLNEYINI